MELYNKKSYLCDSPILLQSRLKSDRFIQINATKTRWESEIEYTGFIGFKLKMMSLLFTGMFKKPVQKCMDQFKVFVEREGR